MTPERRTLLTDHLRGLGLTADQTAFVVGIFETEASRLPRSTPFSSAGMYPSYKNRGAILRESRTGELPYYRLIEHDPDVIAYAHQPDCPVHVSWTTRDGRRRSAVRHADAIVVRRDRVALVDVMTDEELAELANDRADDVVRDPDTGRWACPSAQAYVAPFGLRYEIVTPAEFPRTLIRNLEHLGAAFRAPLPDPATLRTVVDRVRTNPGVALADVLDEAVSEGQVHVLIAAGIVYANLDRDDLTFPRAVPLYPTRVVAEALAARHTPSFAIGTARREPLSLASGHRFVWLGATLEVIAAGPREILVRDTAGGLGATTTVLRATLEAAWADGSLVPEGGSRPPLGPHPGALIARARYEATGQEGLDEAVRRHELLTVWHETSQVPKDASLRSLRRWEQDRRAMEALTGDPFVGLCPKRPAGNTNAKVDPRTDAIIDAAIREIYLVANGTTAAHVVAEVVRRCREAGVPAPHPRTVQRRIDAIPEEDVVAAREGRKAAYRHRQFAPIEVDAAAPNGDFAFAVAHIDGTELDLETAHPETGLPLGRAWLHRMVDGRTGEEIARYVGYVEPSEAVVLELLWRCVARWRVLPRRIVVDLGPEHRGGALSVCCLAHGVEIDWRPKSRPRHGAPVERSFLALDLDLLYALAGNTQTRRNVRQQTKEVDPTRAAIHDIAWLDRLLEEYNAIVGKRIAPHLGQARHDALVAGLAARAGSTIPYVALDERLRFLTMAPVEGTTRVLHPVKGFTVGRLAYHHPSFREPGLAHTARPVRTALGDPSWALVDLGGRYLRVECRSLARVRVTSVDEIAHAGAVATRTGSVAAAANREVKVELAELAARARETAAERRERLRAEMNAATQAAHPAAGIDPTTLEASAQPADAPVDGADDPYAYAWEETGSPMPPTAPACPTVATRRSQP